MDRTTWLRWPTWVATILLLLLSGAAWLFLTLAGLTAMFEAVTAAASSAATASVESDLATVAIAISFVVVFDRMGGVPHVCLNPTHRRSGAPMPAASDDALAAVT
ncbi:MAG TPA: hypothetical protein VIJ41_00275 [Candidatus Nanopelagicales bacterium]